MYSVLVNTCDKFSDCWGPFFTLYKKYWPDSTSLIYLNTEYKEFVVKDLPVYSVRGCIANDFPKDKIPSWSQCLRWALETVSTEIVLYMQEDYFLKEKVNSEKIDEFANLMLENEEIKCIHLTDQAVLASIPSKYEGLNIVDRFQRYRVSCQAALWRKSELQQLLRDNEDAWQFEEYGSKRSGILNNLYLCADSSIVRFGELEILPYIFTGIIQGRWNDSVVALFAANGIEEDFSIRGFISQVPKKPLKKKIDYRLHKLLYSFHSSIDMLPLLFRK